MPSIVNIDGALLPPGEARVSVFDRGFLYGDSVYEVVRTYRGRPFEISAHLRRLAHSAERIGLDLAWDARRTKAELLRTLEASRGEYPPEPGAAPWNAGERYARIVMTRGAGEIGLDPALAMDPRAIVIVQPLHAPPLSAYREGVAVRVVTVQHVSPQAVDPSAKTGNYLSHVLALREARARGAHEALMLDRDGFVTEGTTSNVFAVRGRALLTPPLGVGILEGVTRGIVIGLARDLGVTVREEALRPSQLEEAEEVFITSSAREVLPVTRLGDRAVGAGRPGPVTAHLHSAYRTRADTLSHD
ncbi:MAG TPA: aminotransferase class IV [Anaeromyxobacteraceae bacterium]|nr:aminotransferase class IV [Anaeromyxobacteraceae bacterium]